MNKIVREHYPVEKLPDDLRTELGLVQTVTVTIVAEDAVRELRDHKAAIAELRELRSRLKPSPSDSVERVRALRDEWDD
ncbi:hypothetical protein [Bosea sp. (in: a-proteobacteria)]|uniref:hypothetical protein n=1 Tax=Bosea sp. (in: a-proteobacteria) TaxID=1871050 RepID=UPI003B3B10AC